MLTGTEVKCCGRAAPRSSTPSPPSTTARSGCSDVHIPEYTQGTLDQPRAAAQAQAAPAPRGDRQADRQDQGGRAHAGPAALYFKDGKVKVDLGAGQGQEGLRQAARPGRARLPPGDPAGLRPLRQGPSMRGIAYDRFGDESGPAAARRPARSARRTGHRPRPQRAPPGSTRSTWHPRGPLAGAFPHHFPIVPGWDLAGVVEEVGPAVGPTSPPGDEVFGYLRRDDVQWGTAAELVPAPQRCLAHKPESLASPRPARCRWPG